MQNAVRFFASERALGWAATALSRCDLRLLPSDWKKAATAIALSIVGTTGFILILDCVLFRPHLPSSYVSFFTGPLAPRTLAMCILAVLEELRFRLALMSALVLAAAALWKRTPPAWCFLLIITGAQLANVGMFVLHDPVYASLRYLAVGCVWGWLYWRYGLVSALIGHGTAHLVLDPLLLVGLR